MSIIDITAATFTTHFLMGRQTQTITITKENNYE